MLERSSNESSEVDKASLHSVVLILPKCRQGLVSTNQEYDSTLRRALERFRRVAVKVFEAGVEEEMKVALEGIVEVLEYAICEARLVFTRRHSTSTNLVMKGRKSRTLQPLIIRETAS